MYMKYTNEFGYSVHMLSMLINYKDIHHTLTYWGIILSMIIPVAMGCDLDESTVAHSDTTI